MSYSTINIAADGSTLLGIANHTNRQLPTWSAFVAARGTFGSGTVTLAVSPDGGTTKITLKDKTGSAISLTAAGYANIELAGFSNLNNKPLQIYAVMTGSTTPNVNVDCFDNQ